MRFDLSFERTYLHPLADVWQVLTDASALGAWLMETDFSPVIGREFRMWCDDGRGGTDLYLCKVLELDPLHRMVWSWVLDGQQAAGQTLVEFRLEKVPAGTRLSVRHTGDRDPQGIDKFKSGWPAKLDALEQSLSKIK